jgi:hypothetical protein
MQKVGQGFNASEKYLKELCDKSFLSLWSHTNVFRQPGHELCDLLVQVGDDIIIFSDKQCEFGDSADLLLNWSRWFRKAVIKSANQLWGAEGWIRRDRSRIFLDDKCEKMMPVRLSPEQNLSFHLILVAHGASVACKEQLGGSGSMLFSNDIKGFDQHSAPFAIGDLNISKTFIHVFDDTTLDILLQSLDTIVDFTKYLQKKEAFIRSHRKVIHCGEEDLLAQYLIEVNENGEHDFVSLGDVANNDVFFFEEGIWGEFDHNPQRVARLEADAVSYHWDALIEEFSKHAIHGTQQFVTKGGFFDSERAIRFLAMESRFSRRVLASTFIAMQMDTPGSHKRIRIFHDQNNTAANNYIFLLFPSNHHFPKTTYDEYRLIRRIYLEVCCRVAKLKLPEIKRIIGIAVESGNRLLTSSEDLLVYEFDDWNKDWENRARQEQQDFKILLAPDSGTTSHREYPN